MSTPGEDGHPRSGAGIDPDRPAIHRERPPAVPGLAAGLIRRRPPGARPPLPKDLRGAARFWLIMISLLVVAPFLGLGAAGGSGSYVGKINDAARKLFEHAHSAGLIGVIGAVSLLGSVWTLGILRLATCTVLVMFRRWQHLLAFAGSVLVVGWVVHATTPAGTPGTPLPTGVGMVAGALGPSAAVAGLAVTAVGIAYALVPPGRARRLALAGGGVLLAALGAAQLSGGRDLSGVLTGVIVGVAIPLVLFRLLAPERSFPVSYRRGKSAHLSVEGPRGQAIRRALADQLGIGVAGVEPFGTAGSGGSTPLRIQVAGEPEAALFGKLYALTHLRADRWYKLGRMMLYGALEDEKPFNSVRRLVEYEDYMLRLMADVGVPSAAPYGFVELTPEREYLLVAEFLAGGTEILDAEVSRDTIRDALSIVRRLWNAGIAHRDVKPSNLLVRDGKVFLIDVAFCQVRPSPWRQVVDLANMMLVLALHTSPEMVYQEARGLFSSGEIAEAFAATRGITVPSQLRSEIRKDGRDLIGAFRALAPARAPIRIQRWTVRRLAVTTGVLLGAALAVSLLWASLSAIALR
jgi:tRNA A-37 threonylcarbamoyl transferase component Bud32